MPEEVSQFAELLKRRASQAEVATSLIHLLWGSSPWREIPTAALHPYGFFVLRLGSVRTQALRLHLWPTGHRARQKPDWPVHSHPWSLLSRVICGSLTNEIYDVDVVEQGARHRLYVVRYEERFSILEKTLQRVTCSRVSSTHYSVGDTYSLNAREYHVTIVPPRILCSTIVLTTSYSGASPKARGFEWCGSL